MILLIIVIEVIFLSFSNVINFNHLFPIVGQGWEKIWPAVWPTGITQTFAETLTLAMIWPLVKKTEKVWKITIISTILSGTIIAMFSFMQIIVLGEDITDRAMYPVYILMQQISIADFLENLDAIVSLIMVLTAFVKLTLSFFAAVRAIQLLLKLQSSRLLIYPLSIFIYILGMTMSESLNEHLYVGIQIFPLTLWVPLLIVFPLVLLIVAVIRRKITGPSSKTGKG